MTLHAVQSNDSPMNPGLNPIEFNVVILPDEVKERTASGLFLPDSVKDQEKYGTQRGVLVRKSPHAFTYADWPAGAIPPNEGERVLIGRHTGAPHVGDDGRTYFICKDKDVVGVLA